MNRTNRTEQPDAFARTAGDAKLFPARKASFTPVLPKRKVFTGTLQALLLLLVLVVSGQCAQAQYGLLMIGSLETDTTDAIVTPSKVESALAYATELSGQGRLLPSYQRDSILLAKGAGNEPFDVTRAAKALEATGVLFVRTQRLANLLRVEIVLRAGRFLDMGSTGVGYAIIRHRRGDTLLADPALLAATQRAMCGILMDSSLYASADSGLNVRPTTLVAVGGIEYVNNPQLTPWSLFKEKVVSSFDVVNIIVQQLISHPRYTVIDIDSRDSMMAMDNMFYVENYNAAAGSELKILRAFDIDHIVTGRFERTEAGGMLTLALCTIDEKGTMAVVRTVKEPVGTDTRVELSRAVRSATASLLPVTSLPAQGK